MENNPEVYPEDGDMEYEEGETDGYTVWDMCYHLVKLYTDHTHRLERVLAPTTHTAYQLDYRLRLGLRTCVHYDQGPMSWFCLSPISALTVTIHCIECLVVWSTYKRKIPANP